MNDRAFGEALRRRRQTLGLKQAEVAELAGSSTRFVHSLEAGKTTVRMDKLLDVLEALGLGLRLAPGPRVEIDPRLEATQ